MMDADEEQHSGAWHMLWVMCCLCAACVHAKPPGDTTTASCSAPAARVRMQVVASYFSAACSRQANTC